MLRRAIRLLLGLLRRWRLQVPLRRRHVWLLPLRRCNGRRAAHGRRRYVPLPLLLLLQLSHAAHAFKVLRRGHSERLRQTSRQTRQACWPHPVHQQRRWDRWQRHYKRLAVPPLLAAAVWCTLTPFAARRRPMPRPTSDPCATATVFAGVRDPLLPQATQQFVS
jgi:hypothetical protein